MPTPDFPVDDRPCFQMRSLLSRISDGTLTGIGRWYAERHLARCPRCSAALSTLVIMEARLRALGVPRPDDEGSDKWRLAPEYRERMTVAMDAIDRT